MAHNLMRWLAAIRLGIPGSVVAKTIRRRYLALGRLTRSGRRCRLRLPDDRPWAAGFLLALKRLRAVALRA